MASPYEDLSLIVRRVTDGSLVTTPAKQAGQPAKCLRKLRCPEKRRRQGFPMIWAGDGRTMVIPDDGQLWALNLVTGDSRLLATRNVGTFDHLRMTANRVFWIDIEMVPTWQQRVSWVGLDGSGAGDVVVSDPGNAGTSHSATASPSGICRQAAPTPISQARSRSGWTGRPSGRAPTRQGS